MSTCIALIRGINVGRAKRLAMADLRELLESLGHSEVRTLLNSGNAIFQVRSSRGGALAHSIQAGITDRFGFSAPVIVVTAAELTAIIKENPLQDVAKDPSRHLVAFVSSPKILAQARPLLGQSWAPEAFAIGARAAYLWCGKGIIESTLFPAFSRVTGEAATTRNWATVLKLQAAANGSGRGRG